MKLVAKAEKMIPENKKLVGLLRILGSIEYSIATMKWYVGNLANRQELPPHESVLALAINIASVGEALNTFEMCKNQNIIVYSKKWGERAKSSWDLLHSEKVRELKINHLKLIRDKTAFHIDPEPVKDYLKDLDNTKDITIWETNENDNGGHSPLACEIITNYLLKATFNNKEIAKLSSDVFGAIRDVVLASIDDILHLEIINDV